MSDSRLHLRLIYRTEPLGESVHALPVQIVKVAQGLAA